MLEGGARKELAPGLVAGAQLAYEAGRLASESGFLRDHGLPDVKPGASLGLHLEWDLKLGPTLLTLLARGRQHLDSDLGARADLRASVGIYGDERILAAVFVQGTWANEKSAQSFYGVTPQQSTTLPAFDAGSGALSSAAGLLWSVNLSREWLLVGSAEVRHLEGDAERSPLAERGTNYTASVGLSYLFR
jgi:outer membrane scaffolding protein for murein synthesis (MipA/OmpV family)